MKKITKKSFKLNKKTKEMITTTFKYLVIGCSIFAAFLLGRLFEDSKKEAIVEIKTKVEKVSRDSVNIAIDESSNLIIIDNKTGDYVIYQDSIGHTIFKMYATNLWKQEK